MSGACYPLVSVGDLCAELEAFKGLSRMPLDALPFRPWDTARNHDGGFWRVRRRFVTFRGRVVRVGGVPLRTSKRRLPAGLELRASSQFKVYARRHVAALLRVLDERPDILRFWRTTLVPNEMCAASILASPDLVGDIGDEICDDQPWYIDWGTDRGTTTRAGSPWTTCRPSPRRGRRRRGRWSAWSPTATATASCSPARPVVRDGAARRDRRDAAGVTRQPACAMRATRRQGWAPPAAVVQA